MGKRIIKSAFKKEGDTKSLSFDGVMYYINRNLFPLSLQESACPASAGGTEGGEVLKR